MHLRTVLATLGLGFLGAALTGGASAAASPLAAGLAGGVAGNLATDLFKHLDRKVCERFLDGWSGIDENHHVVAALRLAQINALRALIARFENSLGKDDDRLGDQAGFSFAARVKSFLSEETKVAQARSFSAGSADIDGRKAVIALLPDTFDDALAARRDSSERGEAGSAIAQVRSVTETAVLDELRARCGDGTQCIPALFEDLFLGKEGVAGWFDLFVRDAADKLTHPNSEFAAIWNAEQTALIKAYLEATSATSEASFQAIQSLREQFDSGVEFLARIDRKLDDLREVAGETKILVTDIHCLLKKDTKDSKFLLRQKILKGATLGYAIGRLEFTIGHEFPEARAITFEIKNILLTDECGETAQNKIIIKTAKDVQPIASMFLTYYALRDAEIHSAILMGICGQRCGIANSLPSDHHQRLELIALAKSALADVSDQILPNKILFMERLIAARNVTINLLVSAALDSDSI